MAVRSTRLLSLLALVGAALAALPGSARSQQARDGSTALATPDDSLELWRLPAPALAVRCRGAVASAHGAFETVLASPPTGVAFPALQRVEQANADLQSATVLPRALQVLSPDAATRDTAAACDQVVANFFAAAAADPRLYALAQRAQDQLRTAPRDMATAADRQLAQLYVESGRLAGAGLDSAGRARSVRLLQRHADLERDFSIALAADSTHIRIPLRDTLDLDPQFRTQLARKAKRGGQGGRARSGRSCSRSRIAARGRVSTSPTTGAAGRRTWPGSTPRWPCVIPVRLLGFPNWGAYQVSTRMAKTPRGCLPCFGPQGPAPAKAV